MVCNIGGAFCTSYGSQMATRLLTAILISPPTGNGSGVITELSEPEKRAQKLGWWTLMITFGTPAGPFIMGFVVRHLGVQWIFWIYAIINFCQFVLFIAIGDETIYVPIDERGSTGPWAKMIPRRIGSRQLKLQEIVSPFSLIKSPRILIMAWAHAVTFCYANIALIVEMPIVFGAKFDFDAQQIGLQFIAIIIGCTLGEQVSGPMSDRFLRYMQKGRESPNANDRLWLAYLAYAPVFAGLLTWGFQLQKATTWNVTPCIGAGIASFGNQMVMTLLTTYAVESKRERAGEIGIFINVFRQVYGFVSSSSLPFHSTFYVFSKC